MDAPGFYTLGSFALTAPGTYVAPIGSELAGLDGVTAISVQLEFLYGSGGGSGTAYLQTSLDQANEGGVASGSWIDIAAVSLGTSSVSQAFNFSGLTPVTNAVTPGDGALAAGTAIDGLLGDRFRLKVVTTGTAYGGATQVIGSLVAR